MTDIHQESVKFIKANKVRLLEEFANDDICPSQKEPVAIFMAGSPGAGKTEFSKRLINEHAIQAIRIDADDIKRFIPYYDGSNSDKVQGASALGVEYLYDYAIKKQKHLILDGTFADSKKALSNIKRVIKRGWHVEIYYIYQNPIVAWDFVKKREELEGRMVPKKVFIESFLKAGNNVNTVKKKFDSNIVVHVVIKDFEKGLEKLILNIASSVDNYTKNRYNSDSLMEKL